MFTGKENLRCDETLASKLTYSMKESSMEASVKKGCARRRQVKKQNKQQNQKKTPHIDTLGQPMRT